MAYEVKINTGSIFENEKTSENQPDWKGKLKIDPSIIDENGFIELSLWNNTSQNGLDYKSIQAQTPFKKKESATKRTQNDDPIVEDCIPF